MRVNSILGKGAGSDEDTHREERCSFQFRCLSVESDASSVKEQEQQRSDGWSK